VIVEEERGYLMFCELASSALFSMGTLLEAIPGSETNIQIAMNIPYPPASTFSNTIYHSFLKQLRVIVQAVKRRSQRKAKVEYIPSRLRLNAGTVRADAEPGVSILFKTSLQVSKVAPVFFQAFFRNNELLLDFGAGL